MGTVRTANAHWEGDLLEGAGKVSFDSSGIGAYAVSWPARSAEPDGVTSPEELLAAAHATCFSMALSHALTQAGTPPTTLHTSADVSFTPGTGITGVHLTVRGVVAGVDAARFAAKAREAKVDCPVSQALTGTEVTLDAALA